MPEKIGQGVIWEGPEPANLEPNRDAIEKARNRRDAARATAGFGVGMMFLGSFSANIAVGGAFMLVFGFALAIFWGRRLKKLEGDPWEPDPEIDSWEREHYP